MPKFGSNSLAALSTLHPDLQRLCDSLIEDVDFTVVCGHRDKEAQEAAFQDHKSTKHFPDSKHNRNPSVAMDLAPYPIDWNEEHRFCYFAGYVMARAEALGIELQWGGDWDGDWNLAEHTLHDLPHFELVE